MSKGSTFRVQRSEAILETNRRISNIEPQNFEGWIRFAQPVLIKNDSIPSFDIRYSAVLLFALNYLTQNLEPRTLNPGRLYHRQRQLNLGTVARH